jgi:hypothetical protein
LKNLSFIFNLDISHIPAEQAAYRNVPAEQAAYRNIPAEQAAYWNVCHCFGVISQNTSRNTSAGALMERRVKG